MPKRSRKPVPPTIIPAVPGYWWKPNEAAWPKCGPEPVRIVAWLVEMPEYGGHAHVELHPLVIDLYTVTDARHWLDQDSDEFGCIVHESDL